MNIEQTTDIPPPLTEMMLRGAAARCPACGRGRMFRGYLRVVEQCSTCAAPLGAMRADDAPPYITILITAHLVVALLVLADREASWRVWAMVTMFSVLAGAMSLVLLRPIKGMTVAVLLRISPQEQQRGLRPRKDIAPDDAAR